MAAKGQLYLVQMLAVPRLLPRAHLNLQRPLHKSVVWWTKHIERVASALAERPCGLTVTDTNLMDETLNEAALCPAATPACRGRVIKEMRRFSKPLAVEVDRVIENVSVGIDLVILKKH